MRKKQYLFLSVVGLAALIVFLFPSSLPLRIDDFISRIVYSLSNKSQIGDKIAVVEIDDASLLAAADQWPFRRSRYAEFLKIIAPDNPKVVGFDITFVGESSSSGEDQAFIEAIENFKGRIVLAYFLDRDGRPIYPKPEFEHNALSGFVNAPVGTDKIIRKTRLYFQRDNFSDFSWALKTAAAFKNTSLRRFDNLIKLNATEIPADAGGILNINYLFRPADFERISFQDVIKGNFPAGIFSDRIVLVAPTLDIVHDIHLTPLGYMPGVFIQANVITAILSGRFIRELPFIFDILVLLAALFLTSYCLINFTLLRRLILSAGILLFLFWLDIALQFNGWRFSYGRVAVSTLFLLVVGNVYAYTSFLTQIIELKNKMTLDPLTRLYSSRYFFERLGLELKAIIGRKGHLVLIWLEGFTFSAKSENFEELKATWKHITAFLSAFSRFWSRYSPEIILGRVKDSRTIREIKSGLEAILREEGMRVTVKVGTLKLTSGDTEIKSAVPFLVEKVKGCSENILSLKRKDVEVYLQRGGQPADFLSSLTIDAEERNRQLLKLIEQYKLEEKKASEAYLQLIASLVAALESKDPYTQGHTKRVAEYSLMLARKLDLPEEEIERIRKAAYLHDLGKIGIPDAVLHKHGRLTDDEFLIIKKHQALSGKILEPVKAFQDIIPYIVHHHENFDGSGYPHGLAGDFIPLGARIISVADIFDALTTGRDYREAFSMKKAVETLKEMKGNKLDPILVDKFLAALEESRVISE